MTQTPLNPPRTPASLNPDDLIRWFRTWNIGVTTRPWTGCRCEMCQGMKGVAETLTRLQDGEPYNPSMLNNLNAMQRDIVLKAILLRTVGATK